jgi:predicted RNA methylase
VNTEMNIRVPKNVGKFLSSCTTVVSQEVLISMELVTDKTRSLDS